MTIRWSWAAWRPIAACAALAALQSAEWALISFGSAAPPPAQVGWAMPGWFAVDVLLFMVVLQLAGSRGRRAACGVIALGAAVAAIFAIAYRSVLGTPPPASACAYLLQAPHYAGILIASRISGPTGAGMLVALGGLTWGYWRLLVWGWRDGSPPRALSGTIFIAGVALAAASARAPASTVDLYVATNALHALRTRSTVNPPLTPDRVDLPHDSNAPRANVLFIRLEEVARDITSLAKPGLGLDTTPFLRGLRDAHPDEVVVGTRHFTSSSATEMSLVLLYSGLAATADRDHLRRTPMLWEYFRAAGAATAMHLPYRAAWGGLRAQYEHTPGRLLLDELIDPDAMPLGGGRFAIPDATMVDDALARMPPDGWPQPFLRIVDLVGTHDMADALGMPGVDEKPFATAGPRLARYAACMRSVDQQLGRLWNAMPEATRENTILVVTSDHGCDLYGRRARIESYFPEAALIPLLVFVPRAVQQRLAPAAMPSLRTALATAATSNIDLLPTILDLVGIAETGPTRAIVDALPGIALTRSERFDELSRRNLCMVNTGPLRSWDNEGFGLLLPGGHWWYVDDCGIEHLFDLAAPEGMTRDLVAEPSSQVPLVDARRCAEADATLSRIVSRYRASAR